VDLEKASITLAAKPALIVVDMINGFTDPECPLGTKANSVVEANVRLLTAFRARRLPIFFTQVIYHNDQQAKVFRYKVPALNVLTPESKWVEIDPAMSRQANEPIIEKQWASGFHKTDLDQQLTALGVDSLVVTGLTTSGCVRATAVDGLQYDYAVVVAADAVGDRNQQAHEANLFDMNAKYTGVQNSDEIIASLSNYSSRDKL